MGIVNFLKNWSRWTLVLTCFIILLSSCEKKDDQKYPDKEKYPDEGGRKEFTREIMYSLYLWNDKLPNNVNIYDFPSPEELLNYLKYKELDRWSFTTSLEEANDMLQGKSYSYGTYFQWDEGDLLRVFLVYKNSDAYQKGLRRSNVIHKIDDKDVKTIQDFSFLFDSNPGSITVEFTDTAGVMRVVTVHKTEFKQNAVIYKGIYPINGKKVGYLVYDSFLEYAQDELISAFSYFKSGQVDEMIIDLRYNPGGNVFLADSIASMLIPAEKKGSLYYTMRYNDDFSEYNSSYFFPLHSTNLDLDRVFFITSDFTYSASELVINALKPHMDVQVIGQSTGGKPVGMHVIPDPDSVIVVAPVTFKIVNANGEGDYFEGLPVHKKACDGIDHQWGDPSEDMLYEALFYIEHGYYSSNYGCDTKKSGILPIHNTQFEERMKYGMLIVQ